MAYTITVTGISSIGNYSHNVLSIGGAVSNVSGSGTFIFAAPIHKDNTGVTRTTTVQTTFTRPSSVTGSSYAVQLVASSSNPNTSFIYPSLWVFTAGTTVIPVRENFITGTGFQGPVSVLGNLVSTLSGTITNSAGVPQTLWFAVKATATQPTTFRTGANAGLLSDVAVVTGNTVGLAPDSPLSGYSAVTYNLYGITLQNGSTFVSIS